MSERIPPLPLTQALDSTTFVPPPLDLSLTAADIIDFHRVHSPHHVAYVYEDTPGQNKQITFSTWVRAIHRAGRQLRTGFELPRPQVGGAKPIISLLANSGEEFPTVLFHFVTLTPSTLTPRHTHVCHHHARSHPRRVRRLRGLPQEFCCQRRPPHQ